jgi:PAS domain S-box-containing protein
MTGLEKLSPDLIDAILDTLPVEMTFTGEDGTILYYNRDGKRLSPRSPNLLGQQISECHSPETVEKIESIIEDLRSGRRDVFESYNERGERKVRMRYMAVRGKSGEFLGTLQVINTSRNRLVNNRQKQGIEKSS